MTRKTKVQPFRPEQEKAPTPDYPSSSTFYVKFSLFFLNVLFWLISCLIIAIATYAILNKQELYGKLTPQLATDPAVLLACAGVLMFVITFCGCLGSLRENVCLLRFYSIMLGIMLLVEITTAVLGYVYATKVREQVHNAVDHMIKRYRDDPDLQNMIDYIQNELKCCGSASYKDWENNVYFNCSSPSVERCGVPFSCCISDQINSQCGFGAIKKTQAEAEKVIFVKGCVVAAEEWLKTNLIMIASIAASLPVVQIIGFCCSRKLTDDIKQILQR